MSGAVNFLPGPVPIHESVREAFARPAASHRSAAYLEEAAAVRRALCRLTGAAEVEILVGSGTLANDAVAAQLTLAPGHRGLVLTNGEFGDRLVEQAGRFGLAFDVLRAGWGEPFPWREVRRALAAPGIGWLWAVHCETSTGVLNDLDALKSVAAERGARLCLDGISTIGNLPVDLAGVDLATAVSGKGIGSFPGLSLVFHRRELEPSPALPRYLDLGLYAREQGVPFTGSSNLLAALGVAVARLAGDGFAARAGLAAWLRPRLEARGFAVLAPAEISSPAVLSLLPPGGPSGSTAFALGEALEEEGFLLSYRSGYLVRRGLLQVCLMGEHRREELEALLDAVDRILLEGRERRAV